MRFHIITIFPSLIDSYFKDSILSRAIKKKLLEVKFYNPRDFTKDKHKTVDDKPFGGGPGMVMKAEPIINVVEKILKGKNRKKVKIVILAPAGRQFNQRLARAWQKRYDDIILICGRYEGIDERVKKIFKADEISAGPYVLTGGELPAAIVVDAVSRHIPGVLSKEDSLEDKKGIGIPAYTRPAVLEYKGKKYRVPKILLSGDHKKIRQWREQHSKELEA